MTIELTDEQMNALIASTINGVLDRVMEKFEVEPTISLDEAAKMMGLCRDTAIKVIMKSGIDYVKFDRLYRFKPSEINKIIKQRTIKRQSP